MEAPRSSADSKLRKTVLQRDREAKDEGSEVKAVKTVLDRG